MAKRRILGIVLVGILGTSSVSSAWGPPGHKTVATLASTRLNQAAVTAIASLLPAGHTPHHAVLTSASRGFSPLGHGMKPRSIAVDHGTEFTGPT
jgi:hypothetical protein